MKSQRPEKLPIGYETAPFSGPASIGYQTKLGLEWLQRLLTCKSERRFTQGMAMTFAVNAALEKLGITNEDLKIECPCTCPIKGDVICYGKRR